jgi:hypothetical protein
MGWTLDAFLTSKEWSHEFARKSLPVLVARAEKYRDYLDIDVPEFTYGDLAMIVASKEHAHPIHYALGSIGYALQDLQRSDGWKFGNIPPIELMVWTKGHGYPGDDAFFFLGLSKQEVKKMSSVMRKSLASTVLREILNYPYWREVVAAFNLRPVTLSLPDVDEVKTYLRANGGREGESAEHKNLKYFIGRNLKLLNILGHYSVEYEECLMSGDRPDIILNNSQNSKRICIEVKSRISKDDDLIRGIFQCIKYRSILAAQEKYELSRTSDHHSRKTEVFFVTERSLPESIKRLCELFDIAAYEVTVPEDFKMQVQS